MKELFGPATGGVGHIGTWVKSAAAESAEIMAFAGFDFVVIDLEHTPLSLSDAYGHIIAASALGIPAVVRVPDHTPAAVGRIMDAGAAGILVPHVDTVEQARRVSACLRFPPHGTRGSGNTSRAGKWGQLGRSEYVRFGNEDTVCIPQLESEEAIANAAEILAVPDVTAALVGASDLALDSGLSAQDPELQAMIDSALEAGRNAGKGIGCAIEADAEAAARSFARGFGFAVIGSDLTMLAKTACALVAETRKVARVSAARMTGSEALARMLDGYGVTHFFMVPAVIRQTMVEIERLTSIKRVQTHGEKSAAYMADGYARVSGRPGVCGAQVIGALNLAAGLRDAYLAGSPVIAITGGRDPRTKFRGVYQEVDDVPAFEPVTKFNATVDAVERIPDMLRQAFRAAVTGGPGPVHLQFRGNEAQLDADTGDLDTYVESTFAQVPPFRTPPVEEHVQAAVAALAQAERPVIVAGGGVRWSGARDELLAFAEKTRIPVATSLNGKDTMPGAHPLAVGVVGSYSRSSANLAVKDADLVCFVGTRTGGMTTNFWELPQLGTPVVPIDIEPANLGRNYPLAVAVAADAKLALARMTELAEPPAGGRAAWLERLESHKADYQAAYDGALSSDAVPIRPERICGDLTRFLPDDAIVVVDTGFAGTWMGAMYDTGPRQSYVRSAGHLGWAFPAGLGAKAAAPDRPVVVFTGDAGLWYHIAEIETAVRWGLNTVTVVNNNSSGIQTRRGFQKVFERAYDGQPTEHASEVWSFNDVDFARIAESMGATGVRVTKPGELEPALAKALETPGPVVIDVVTDIDAEPPLAV